MALSSKRMSVIFVEMLVLAGTLTPAYAGNVMFLKGAPIAKMTDDDYEMFLSTARKALEDSADGESLRWVNSGQALKVFSPPLSRMTVTGCGVVSLNSSTRLGGIAGRSILISACKRMERGGYQSGHRPLLKSNLSV